jgi:hypothetical protein
MTEPNLTQSLLTLFTTPEKAEEIEGDFIEQAPAHGRLWLRVQLVQTWFALAFAAFRQEPVHTILLSYAIYELARRIDYSIVNPIRLYVLHDTNLSMTVLVWVSHICWALSGFCIGAALVYFLPKFAVRATLGAAFLILLPEFVKFGQVGNAPLSAIVLFAIAPLLAGCFHMHRKRLAQASLLNKTA